jgi:acyl-CoA thioesterase-1
MHVAQPDHARAFDGRQDMGGKLAGNSGALAAGTAVAYGDCPRVVNALASWAETGRRVLWLVLALVCAAATTAQAQAQTVRIAMLGDSLTAGFGLPPDQALPARLEQALKSAGRDVAVANHGVSGDTTAGGLARLDWTLGDKPALVILALGANDALRGLDPDETGRNLDAIIARTKASGAALLLCGMKAPRNYGPDYVAKFDALYEQLAAKHAVALMPFLLESVAMMPDLNQPDGMHPNARGVDVIVSNLAPAVTKALDALKRPGG